jgi:transposase
MHFVPAKSLSQQAQGMVLKVRDTLIGQRTLLVNTLRGHASQFGVVAGKGVGRVGHGSHHPAGRFPSAPIYSRLMAHLGCANVFSPMVR